MKQFYYYLFFLPFCSSCFSASPGDLEKVEDYNAVGTWESWDGRYLFLYPDSCFILRDLCRSELPYEVSPDSISVFPKRLTSYADGKRLINMEPGSNDLNYVFKQEQETKNLSLKDRNGTWQIRPWDDGLQYAQLIGSWDTSTYSCSIYPEICLFIRAKGRRVGRGGTYVYKCPVCQNNLAVFYQKDEMFRYFHHVSDTVPTDIDAFIRYRKQHPELKCSFWTE